MLSRLASGHAQTRRAVARLLGVHRHTMGHWLGLDETRGLDALLALYVPAGKALSRRQSCRRPWRKRSGNRPA